MTICKGGTVHDKTSSKSGTQASTRHDENVMVFESSLQSSEAGRLMLRSCVMDRVCEGMVD